MRPLPCLLRSSAGATVSQQRCRGLQLRSMADAIRRSICWTMVHAAGVAACSGQPSVEVDPAMSAARERDSLAGQDARSAPMHALRVHVVAPGRAVAGRAVPLRLVVSNTGSTKVDVLQSADPAPDYDLTVAGEDRRIVWKRVPPDDILTLAGFRYTLTPGESHDLETILWDQRDLHGRHVEPGRYTIQGVFYGGVAWSGEYQTHSDTVPIVIER
jgi:hypothetical protein